MKHKPPKDALTTVRAILALHDRTAAAAEPEPEFDLVDQPGVPYRTAPRRVEVVLPWSVRAASAITAAVRTAIVVAIHVLNGLTSAYLNAYWNQR